MVIRSFTVFRRLVAWEPYPDIMTRPGQSIRLIAAIRP